ncbi:unnamed protein product, partial [Chrysoparadoxa australica]
QSGRVVGFLDVMEGDGLKPDVVSYSMALQACARTEDSRTALEMLQAMRRAGLRPEVRSYNAAIAAQGDDLEQAQELLKELEDEGLQPNFATYANMIGVANRAGHLRALVDLYAEMQGLGLLANVFVYNCVCRAFMGLETWRWAVLVHVEARGRGLASEITFAAAVVGYLLQGSLAEAKVEMKRAVSAGLSPGLTQLISVSMGQAMRTGGARGRGNKEAEGQGLTAQEVLAAKLALDNIGIKLDDVGQAAYIRALVELGRLNEALSACGTGTTFPASKGLQVASLYVHAKLRSWSRIMDLFSNTEAAGMVPDTLTYITAVSVLSRAGQADLAMQLVDAMAEKGLGKGNAYAITAMMSACSSAGMWERALKLRHTGGNSKSTAVYNTAIKVCATAKQLEVGLALLREMWDRSVDRNVNTYNTVMDLCKECGQSGRVVGFLDVMEGDGLKPDVISYNIAISSCEGAADVATAFDLLARMKRRGIQADQYTYNSLLSACSSAGQLEDCLLILEDMKAGPATQAPDTVSYSTIISACAKAKRPALAKELFQEMKNAGVQPNDRTYCAVISTCGEEKDWQRALQLHAEAVASGATNTYTYSVAMSVCAQSRRWEEALQLLKDMQQRGIQPDAYSYAACIWALCNSKEYARCLEFFSTIEKQALHAECYLGAITACSLGDQHERALLLLQEMHQRSIPRTAQIYNLALSACEQLSAGDKARELLTLMKLEGISPSTVSYNRAIRALCAESSQWREASVLVHEMAGEGVRSNVHGLVSCVCACALSEGSTAALSLLSELLEVTGLPQSVPLYNSLVSSGHRRGEYELADVFYSQAVKLNLLSHWANDSTLDLHGFSLPLAHAAVRCMLNEVLAQGPQEVRDLVIITGKGKGSLNLLQPVVRPEVQRMLIEEFYPPLYSFTVPGNP